MSTMEELTKAFIDGVRAGKDPHMTDTIVANLAKDMKPDASKAYRDGVAKGRTLV